jgi:chromosome partitioning protein
VSIKVVRTLARLAIVATAILAALLLIYWDIAVELIKRYEPLLKLIGLLVAPIFAFIGFLWTRIDKQELKTQARLLGAKEKEAEHAQRKLEAAKIKIAAAAAEIEKKLHRIADLEADLVRITNSTQLWKVRERQPFPEYYEWLRDPQGAKIITVGLFKGGVGKTHVAINFAAYVSEQQKKPVLLIDLDYQGSMTSTVLLAAGIEQVGSHVDALLANEADIATMSQKSIHLAPALSRGWVVPADYTLNNVESQLLLHWMLSTEPGVDVRYRLAHVLLNPVVRRQYAAIIIDTPPRMTLGAVNAFVASHFYLVPTILDRTSSEAVRPFLDNVELMKTDLALDLRLAGIISTMTRETNLKPNEAKYQDRIRDDARELFRNDHDYMIKTNIPRRAAVTNGETVQLPYFLKDSEHRPLKDVYDAVFADVWSRIMSQDSRQVQSEPTEPG